MSTFRRINHLTVTLILAPLSAVPSFANSVFTNDVLSLSPIAYWQFDGNLTDSSGNGHNGTSSSGITFTAGAPDGDASNQAVSPTTSTPNITVPDAGNSMNFDFTNSFSVMSWVFIPTTQNTLGTILSRESAGGLGYFLGVDTTGRLFFETSIGGGAIIAGSTTTFNTGSWHFVVGTFSGSSSTVDERLYVDGNLLADNNRGNAGTFSDPGGSVNFFCCGVNDGVFPWGSWTQGSLDEAAIFGSALTQTQVQTLYSAASQSSSSTTPEPSTAFAIGTGLVAIAFAARRRK